MIGKILTKENQELLRLIYSYGGYIRISHLEYIKPGVSHTAKYLLLDKLVKMKYLTTRRLRTESKREPITYQVTKSTCRLFLNPESYYRKKHKEEYIYRALIKSYFCFQNHIELDENIVSIHEEKIKIFEAGKFNKDLFPRKYNKDSSFVHFEEVLINFTQNKGKNLMCEGQLLYDDSMNTLLVTYIDQCFIDIKKQIVFIVNRYIDLINSGGIFNINFLIVVDDDKRKMAYNQEIIEFENRYMYREKLSDELIKFYLDYLVKYYDDISKAEELHSEFKSGELKKKVVDRIKTFKFNELTEQQNLILNEVSLKGKTYIINKLKEIVSTYGGFQKCFEIMDSFFTNLFLLEYNNYFSLNNEVQKKFHIKTYKIAEKVHF
ncbi:hypothetical protein [Terrisporobacter glycolicus]|uniref:hypothetical protein n=1 Tax=Terrisporobacter glycolicus TaxID=36841 RepID=UPI003463B1A7